MSIESINTASEQDARHSFRQCCTSERWVELMVAGRPYHSPAELMVAADNHWNELSEEDYLQAFDGHPKIGDVGSLKAKYADTKTLAAGEQASVAAATDDTIHALAQGNSDYENTFGFIFIVCATGKNAAEMLGLLQARLPNDRSTELRNAAEEQRKIFHIRLEKLL
ncbi:MAG: 2-oxo-4-hydroxy-4-carboxy-5-ureidoimidazoline decarboxylase [Halioglobus sp.]